ISDLCLHFAANRTTEAKSLADTLLAAAKGTPLECLEACASNLTSMDDVLANLPAGQDDMNAYLTAKNFRANFKHDDPPICERDCRNKASTADETIIT
uniref:Pectinesterase inhibitor domain-containing protein n=1 Tax=Setaria italica TaxID=4555 RepID=K3Z0P7_SETIT